MAPNPRSEMSENPSTQRVLMWSVSSSLADTLFNWSNVALVVGASLVLIGTIGAIKMGAIREHFSDLRISDNERATKTATAESDVAKANAAKANLRAAELEKESASLKADNLSLQTSLRQRRLS